MRLPVTQSQCRADTARSTINQFELSTCSEQYSIHVRIAINEVIELTAEVARCGRCHGRLVVVMSRCVPCVAWALLPYYCVCAHADPSQPRFASDKTILQESDSQSVQNNPRKNRRGPRLHTGHLTTVASLVVVGQKSVSFRDDDREGLTEQTGRRFRWVGGWGGRVGGRG